MKTILKIALKNLRYNRKRAVFTLLCVILSVSMIAVVLSIVDSVLANTDFGGRDDLEQGAHQLGLALSAVACFMSCFTIYTTFSISLQERIKSIGFLTSVGMSPFQKSMLILCEAAIYAVIGVIGGVALGFGISSVFYNEVSGTLASDNVYLGNFAVSGTSVFLSLFLGIFSVLTASFFPMLKARRLSVTETMKDGDRINVSLKQTRFSRIAERIFGRIGTLAGQNYDHNKIKYRSVAFALSGGTIFFITIYAICRYPYWYELDRGRGVKSVEPVWIYLEYAALVLAAFFVFVFLFCSLGSIRQNIEQRKTEFAMLKSMGMQNRELQKMMSIECIFLAWYSMYFGLIGSLAADAALFSFFSTMGAHDLSFHFPFGVYAAFCVMDLVVCLLFALYARIKISRVNIIETIRSN